MVTVCFSVYIYTHVHIYTHEYVGRTGISHLRCAFSALLANGDVITWGQLYHGGGDSASEYRWQRLTDVHSLQVAPDLLRQ